MVDRDGGDPELDQLRSIERDRLRALVEGDIQRASLLHADDFQLVPPVGIAISKAEYLGSIEGGSFAYAIFEPENGMEVRLHGDCAVIRYIARIQVVVDDTVRQPVRVWHLDVYEKRDGQWQDVWSQATMIPG